MEIKDMNLEEVIARMNAIPEELKKEGADIDALETEANSLIERKNHLIAQKKAEVKAVIEDQGETITENVERTQTMENVITRNSPEYVNAYAEYIKTGDEKIVRSLLTENVNGKVAVPEIVENRVRTAWERNEIWNRIPKSYLKGNYKVQFEISGSPAVFHQEGADPINEEELVLGIAQLNPVYFKKYIQISDEAMSLTGEAFLNYIYDEITYKIIITIVNGMLEGIANTSSTPAPNMPAVAHLHGAASVSDIINAEGQLQGDLSDVVVITSRSAYATYRALQLSSSFAYDVFDGLPVLFTDQLPAGVRAIVGSLADGVHANLPNGNNVEFKIDDTSIAVTSQDMVAVLGRMYAGVGLVRNMAFCVVEAE